MFGGGGGGGGRRDGGGGGGRRDGGGGRRDCGGGDEASAARVAALPTWCFHGESDSVVPVGLSRSMIAAIKAAGGTPVYSELEGIGHDSWTPAHRNPAVLDWLFAQRRR